MKKFIVLLRGVNVGGKNKISMAALKASLVKLGFTNVITYINSGNIILNSSLDEAAIKNICETIITDTFHLNILVCVISVDDLRDALANAPLWWNNNNDSKHNAIFVIPPATAAAVCTSVGESTSEYEQTAFYGNVIFWSAPLATFSHTRWSKITLNKAAYNAITIRNANTTLKLFALAADNH